MTLCLLVGGDADGKFYELPGRNVRWSVLVPNPPTFDYPSLFGAKAFDSPGYVEYRRQTIACPDRWLQDVYVHPEIDIYAMTESDLISIVMRHWRESHRRVKPHG